MRSLLNLLLSSIVLYSCSQKIIPVQEKSSFPAAFDRGLEAHGGLEKWNSFGTLTFSEVRLPDTTMYTVDLKNRNEVIEKTGHYKVGFTPDEISIYPTRDSFPHENPRFYQNLRFYFFAIAFVTADPGANQTELPPAELHGKMYNRVKITYDDGIGIAPKDQYILWYSQKDNTLAMINYSVTYFNEANAEKYSAIVYKNWTDVHGLRFPTEMIGYRWEKDQLGEERYRMTFTDISLSKKQLNRSYYTDF